jgi:hypothetical protein
VANFIKQGASSPELTRVSSMSEIGTGCRSRILPRMYNGDEPESDATNQWPIQPTPPKGAWSIWKKYLGFIVTSQTTLADIVSINSHRTLFPLSGANNAALGPFYLVFIKIIHIAYRNQDKNVSFILLGVEPGTARRWDPGS